MAGKLSHKNMDQLEQWIGAGPKTFTLLYAITRDGCNATTFHQKCDNHGPTVTVLYNQQNSVYGGYAPVSWNCGNQYLNNNAAFLFQLQLNGSNKSAKFPLKQTHCQYAMYNNQSYGPTFGGHDLLTSVNTVNSSGTYFPLNGSTNFGHNYDMQGITADLVNNGNMNVTEPEVYNHQSYGPTFGGHDLLTFVNTVNSSGTYFTLNGSTNFGHSYDMQGITAKLINNGNMNVIELEVYKVTDGKRHKPLRTWRKTRKWDEKFLNELTEEIVSFKPNPDLGVTETRILVIGPVGAGKSSFYNTINSVFQGRITQKAYCGSAEKSLTTTFTPYKVKVKSGSALNFRLCDTPGLEESQGLDVLECSYLLDGNIPDYYQFNPTSAITPKTHGFKPIPSANDTVHCVVFVLDITTLDVLSTKIVEKIKGFQEMMKQRGIPQTILLSKIDKLDEDIGQDVSLVFSHPYVEEVVKKSSQLFGLPPSNVLPVKNYENEDEPEENKSILALLALRKILHFTEDFFDQMLDKRNDEQSDSKKKSA